MDDNLQPNPGATDSTEHEFARRPKSSARPVELDDPETVRMWCTRHGISEERLRAAAAMIGTMPAALTLYFETHGVRTKSLTNRMRAIVRSRRDSESRHRDKTGA